MILKKRQLVARHRPPPPLIAYGFISKPMCQTPSRPIRHKRTSEHTDKQLKHTHKQTEVRVSVNSSVCSSRMCLTWVTWHYKSHRFILA